MREEDVQINDIVLVMAQITRYVAKEDCEPVPKGIRDWRGLPYRVTMDLEKISLIARAEDAVVEEIISDDEDAI